MHTAIYLNLELRKFEKTGLKKKKRPPEFSENRYYYFND